jgi:glycosyltransferase involved in cell wall biosynthesis
VYAAGLAAWQRRLAGEVDAFVVPSQFAVERLRGLGAPLGETHVVGHVVREFAGGAGDRTGGYALFVGRLAAEKGADLAIEAARRAGVDLVVAGDGPLRDELVRGVESGRRAGDPAVRFAGRVSESELAGLRAGAGVAVVPSRSGETFGLAAAEAMAAGVPVVAARIGGLPELVGEEGLVPPGDVAAMAAGIRRLRGDAAAGERALERARRLVSPETIAPALAAVYGP